MSNTTRMQEASREIRKREHNIRCLSCDRVLLTADLTAGTIKLQCPKCGTPIVVTAKNSRLAVCEDGWDDLAKAE